MTDPWPESLDAPIAAPVHHPVHFENDQVRVLDARVGQGDTIPLHTHCWPAVQYILSFAEFVRRAAGGEILVDSRRWDMSKEAPFVLWSEPTRPHTLENVGDGVIHAIAIEPKSSPAEPNG